MRYDDIAELEPVAFCYWLQGAIEIGELTSFTQRDASLILKTLTNVSPHNLFTMQALLMLGSMPPEVAFVHINRELQQMFHHVIDNSYDGDIDFQHRVHRGEETVLEE